MPGIANKPDASRGISKIDGKGTVLGDFEVESWIIGACHTLTKSLNIVAGGTAKTTKMSVRGKVSMVAKGFALGAIMFF